jgi:hypothetical protein
MCGLSPWEGFSDFSKVGRCSHVFDQLVRRTRPLAIMLPRADQKRFLRHLDRADAIRSRLRRLTSVHNQTS